MKYLIFDIDKRPQGSEKRSEINFRSNNLAEISRQMKIFFRYFSEIERDKYHFMRDREPTLDDHLEKVFDGSYFRILNFVDETDAKIPFVDLIYDRRKKLCLFDFG